MVQLPDAYGPTLFEELLRGDSMQNFIEGMCEDLCDPRFFGTMLHNLLAVVDKAVYLFPPFVEPLTSHRYFMKWLVIGDKYASWARII